MNFSYCLATPRGEGGLAVFELRGPDARPVVERVFRGRGLPSLGASRLGALVAGDESIDEVLVTHESAAATWCSLEAWTLSIHGGAWLQERVDRLLRDVGGDRRTHREVLEDAVTAGALDAVRAAAIDLLPDARTERAAAFLLRQASGELTAEIEALIELAAGGSESGA